MNLCQAYDRLGVKKCMPKDKTLQTILVIGSGPIVIGQAAEFDYSGTQGCLALKEDGYKVILINNNPATIMTDEMNADAVYFEPLTLESVQKVIEKERPDGLLATLGGQTGLNLAFELHEQGVLEKFNVKLLGTPIESIKKGEDRELFKALMNELKEPVPDSQIVTSVNEAVSFAVEIGFPIIVRPAYTLGGTGGGIAESLEHLLILVKGGLQASPISQCLLEKSIAGLKEIEYEVMRDEKGTCITVCNMENIDPVGIHTGDSIVVAPSQTLTDVEYQMLRSASIKIISALGIIGGCNIQFALDPNSKKYFLIEVNPRVSRSSALASKATGYPIARMATKLAIGYTLDELVNPITGDTYASFEPSLDYIVVKFPCFPFDKFLDIDSTLGTQMKATGEVMAIDRNIERAFQKAVNSLEGVNIGLTLPPLQKEDTSVLLNELAKASEKRFFVVLELLRRGFNIKTIHDKTKIDLFFLQIFQSLIQTEETVRHTSLQEISVEFMQKVKEKGFSDRYLAFLLTDDEKNVRTKRKEMGIIPCYKMVDTCAAEFSTKTAYYYSSYFGKCEVEPTPTKKVLIIGSGPIRIGQGIEFDYSSVHGVFALKEEGYETVLINNNPETVSTDFAIADRLYFEPLQFEDVLNVIEKENIEKVIVQFGGQTSINLAKELEDEGIELVGINQNIINKLEDRELFYQFLEGLDIPHIPGAIANSDHDLEEKANSIGFPLLLRPSYVIGGKGMIVVHTKNELNKYTAKTSNKNYPLLLDAYLPKKEVEIDLLTDGIDILIPTIIEHIEKAGIHSGDSFAILPAISLSYSVKDKIVEYARKIAINLNFKGIMNIQYVINDQEVYVLEVNPRASRTSPIVSKVTGVPMVRHATKLLLGKYLPDLSENTGLLSDNDFYTVKFPVFSTMKLGADPITGPEMKSTGEGIGIADNLDKALGKVFHSYLKNKQQRNEILIVTDDDMSISDISELSKELSQQTIKLLVNEDVEDWIERGYALAYLNVKKDDISAEYRKLALANGIEVFTQLETFFAFIKALNTKTFTVHSIQEWRKQSKGVTI